MGVLGDLDPAWHSVALRSAGHVDRVPEQAVAGHSPAHNPSHHGSAVDTNTHLLERSKDNVTAIYCI